LLQCSLQSHQIGVITFYSAQVKKIMQHLHKGHNEISRQVKISTVDGFQGGERDITLLSMVRTSKSVGFVNDPRRVNVTMRHELSMADLYLATLQL
jgi:superfamily I DNA and/or RNA helicase